MSLKIRPLLLSDYYKGYIQLLQQLSSMKDIEYITFKKKWFEIANNPFHKILILQIDNDIIASGTLIMEPKFIRNSNYAGHIEDIVVNNKFRGKGYGTKIVNSLLDIAKKYKCYRVTLNCQTDKFDFYKKMGFVCKSNALRIDFN